MSYTKHYSVLNKESVDLIMENREEGKQYFADLTFGAGGHTFAILERNAENVTFSVDQDPDALRNGQKRIDDEGVSERATLLAGNFEQFPDMMDAHMEEVIKNAGGLQGVVMDLGVSSHHFDEGSRGFSFRFDAPLDMRMNYGDEGTQTAADLINTLTEFELEEIFRKYGEEKFSKRIAQKICEDRVENPIKTTKDLENLVFHCYPKKLRFGKTNPATKVFQALRIAVNRELDVIENVVPRLLPLMKIGGRIAIITFHSLEDRIVKTIFKDLTKGEIPCQVLTKKPIVPSDEELSENKRSRSAKLRVLERTLEFKKKNKYEKIKEIRE